MDVKWSKIGLLTFTGNFYTTKKANLDGEVADSCFKGQNVPWRSENERICKKVIIWIDRFFEYVHTLF